jgi:TatD DNase family protein
MEATAEQTLAYAAHGNCYLNLTSRCTLRCRFCPKFHHQWEVNGADLQLRSAPTARQVVDAVGDPASYEEVVFCGLGEPTLRLAVLLDAAEQLRSAGGRVRVDTDGLASWREGRDITPELAGRVDSLSVSLNAQSAELYVHHCRPPSPGAYPAMLAFVARARAHVPSVTLTAIAGLEWVDLRACQEIATDLGVNFRRRELGRVG